MNPEARRNNKTTILVAVAAVAALSLAVVAISSSLSNGNAGAAYASYKPVTREFWLFNDKVNGMNDTMVGLPGDKFSMPTISATQGDTIIVHFYNVEGPGGDSHSFTIMDKPYDNINVVVKPGTNQTITFKATQAGVFTYICTFHQPSMRGQLIISA